MGCLRGQKQNILVSWHAHVSHISALKQIKILITLSMVDTMKKLPYSLIKKLLDDKISDLEDSVILKKPSIAMDIYIRNSTAVNTVTPFTLYAFVGRI